MTSRFGMQTTITMGMTASGQTSPAIGNDNKARLAYFRNTAHDLYYLVQNGVSPATWYDPQLVDDGNTGANVSLALYSGFNLGRIAYTGHNGSTLNYTSQSLLFPSGTYWQTPETLESLIVESFALALDAAGQPQIYYYKAMDTHLHTVYKRSSGWVNLVFDSSGLVGRGLGVSFSSLNGLPALSYFDENNSWIRNLYQLYGLFLPVVRR
jgi:hypothetical protein